jgi:hypothetical protein
MRSLVLLALTALAALPLSAHEHGRCRVLVVEAPRPLYRHDYRERWEHRDHDRRDWHRADRCEEDRILVRPRLATPPFGLGLDIRIR